MINGPFYRNSKTRVASVTDGLSNTVFIGETLVVDSDNTWVGVVPFSSVYPSRDCRRIQTAAATGWLPQRPGYPRPSAGDHPCAE